MKYDLHQEVMNSLMDRESRRVTPEQYLEAAKQRIKREEQIKKNIELLPDAKKHQIVSFIKSGVRILGYVLLPFNILAASIVLVLSEIIGIIEELV